MNNHRQIWNEFCTTHSISTNKVPLFETSSGLAVKTKQIGKPPLRSILCRSLEMDTLIRTECAKLIDDWKQKAFAYDGLIYMMLVEEHEGVVPLYIGKAETLGNFLLRLARLGGYQNRTRDTPPGNMVLWRGMARLTDIHIGYCLAKDVGN